MFTPYHSDLLICPHLTRCLLSSSRQFLPCSRWLQCLWLHSYAAPALRGSPLHFKPTSRFCLVPNYFTCENPIPIFHSQTSPTFQPLTSPALLLPNRPGLQPLKCFISKKLKGVRSHWNSESLLLFPPSLHQGMWASLHLSPCSYQHMWAYSQIEMLDYKK